jgi:hypothetical protein
MNPGADRETLVDSAPDAEEDQSPQEPVESRSWEPPCWPSDGWDSPLPMRRRAIGWRGSRVH